MCRRAITFFTTVLESQSQLDVLSTGRSVQDWSEYVIGARNACMRDKFARDYSRWFVRTLPTDARTNYRLQKSEVLCKCTYLTLEIAVIACEFRDGASAAFYCRSLV